MRNELPEMIICAANWYKDLPLNRTPKIDFDEIPKAHVYPVNVDRGVVFCGHRHHNCMYMMICQYGLLQHEAGEEIQGFLTNKNRFVDRYEGAEIAIKAGQVREDFSSPRLHSEDLY